MTSERCEASDRLPAHTEGRNTIGDHLLGIGNDLKNRVAKRLEGGALRLFNTAQIFIDLFG